ncbi:hypothetical protein EV701_101223 [Chthoniobacter flavus]|nr:hypothetical protein EV701_101223 [Chthoniobacter flavus]
MREMVALLLGVVLIATGWEKSYRDHCIFIAATISRGGGFFTSQPAANGPAVPATVHSDPSWMQQKSVLDSTKQSGVDRSGVHTNEPLLHQTR